MGKLKKWYIRTFESVIIHPVRSIVSFELSQSRWGLFSFLISISFFFFALASSVYAVYITVMGGTIMLPTTPNTLFIVYLVMLGLATLFGISSGLFAIYFLLTQGTTSEARENRLLRRRIRKISMSLQRLEKKVNKDDKRHE